LRAAKSQDRHKNKREKRHPDPKSRSFAKILGETSAAARTSRTIQQAQGPYKELQKLHFAANKDDHTVEQLDPGAKIRPEIQTEGQKATDESDH